MLTKVLSLLRTSPIALVLLTVLRAQPTFWTLAIEDDPPLALPPLSVDVATSDAVFMTRATLSPAARARLAAGLGFECVSAIDSAAMGPSIQTRSRPGRIPGDPRLRIEYGEVAIAALGRGASVEESVAAALAEPMPAAVLVGAAPDATVPEGWKRCGDMGERPVVWTRQLNVQHSRFDGGCRRITFMDGALHEPEVGALLRRYYARREWGLFPLPLRGIAADPDGAVYWSWTDRIVRTSSAGDVLAAVDVRGHQGDLTWHDGCVVVAVNQTKSDDSGEGHDSWVWVFDDKSLEVVARHRLPEVRYGVSGICWAADRYVVGGGLPVNSRDLPDAANEVHEYDAGFRWLRTVRLPSSCSGLGIQTAEFAYGRFFFGCYGEPPCVLVASPDLRQVERLVGAEAAHGVARGPAGMLLLGWDRAGSGRHQGGMKVLPPSRLWKLN